MLTAESCPDRRRASARRPHGWQTALWGAVTATVAAVPALAGAQVVTLEELERRALDDPPALAPNGARIRAAEAEEAQAASAYNPRLSAEVSGQLAPGRELVRVRDPEGNAEYLVSGARPIEDGAAAFTPQVRYGVDLQLSTVLYDFGRTRAAVDAGRARGASARADRDAARALIVDSVRVAYLAWLSAFELRALARESAHDSQLRRERVEALIAEGVRPQADLPSARTDELLAELELERALGQEREARLVLSQSVGAPIADSAEPDRSLLLEARVEPDAAPDDPVMRALSQQRAAARAAVRVADKSDAPVLAGSLSAGVRAQQTSVFPNYAVGVSLTVPLWDGGASAAEADGARARADELGARMANRSIERHDELARAELTRSNAEQRLARAQALLEVATQRLSDVEQRYELGGGSIEPIGEARSMLRRAQTEVVLARVARARAIVLARAAAR